MGLLWSLRQVPGSKPGMRWVGAEGRGSGVLAGVTGDVPLRLRKIDMLTPMEVTISVYPGHQGEGFPGLVPLASVVAERWYMSPGVRRIPVTEDGLTATLFLPPGGLRFH